MTESEEMYLLTIARLTEEGHEGPVPLSTLAEQLSVMPVSANQMVRKLDEEGVVEYQPYKGVRLLEEGHRRAQSVLRHRRLWEVFFVEHLGLSLADADALACRMEHLTPPEVAERLYEFLGQPSLSPQGKLIPLTSYEELRVPDQSLSELRVGESAEVTRIEGDAPMLSFLAGEEIVPDVRIRVQAIGAQGGMLLEVHGRQVNLSRDVVEQIHVHQIHAE